MKVLADYANDGTDGMDEARVYDDNIVCAWVGIQDKLQ